MQVNHRFQLLTATSNPGKIKEMRELLADLPLDLKGLDEFPGVTEVAETGATFAANAVLKARAYARQTGVWALADDSGLEVEALNFAPGVFSARYAGENADDAQKIEKLLRELTATGSENRRARFVCAAAIADETGAVKFESNGVCAGKIARQPAGNHGFGYDPIFIPDTFGQTFGELSSAVKHDLSHRGKALAKVIEYLSDFINT